MEEQFYIFLPLFLLYGFSRVRESNRLKFLMGIALIPMALRTLSLYFFVLPAGNTPEVLANAAVRHQSFHNAYDSFIYWPFFTHADSLFIGVIVGYVHNFRPDIVKQFVENKKFRLYLLTSVLTAYTAYTIFVYEWEPGLFSMVFRFAFYSACYGLLILLSMRPGTILARFLSQKVFVVFAKISYSTYLIHVLTISPFIAKYLHPERPLDAVTFAKAYVSMLAFSCLCGYLYFLIVEHLFMMLKNRLFS